MNELEAAYKWLSRGEIAYPHDAIGLLAAQIERCLQDKNFAQARTLSEELKYATDAIAGELVQAQVRIVCACAAYGMGEPDEAFQEINRAIALLEPLKHRDLDYKHVYAAANWLLGKLFLGMPDQHKAALTCYQVCLDAFRSLVYWPDSVFNWAEWYKQRCKEMEKEIEAEVRGAISGVSAVVGLQPAVADRVAWPISDPTRLRRATLRAGPFTSITVLAEISAGDFLPSGGDPEPLETIALKPLMEAFVIAGDPFNLYHIRPNEFLVTLKPAEKYYILKVSGDSMNDASIESGCYVLVRQQYTADNNDIVAAINIEAGETTATLKWYVKKNSTIELQPRSKNSKHKPLPIDKSKEATYIRAVVLGIFKPSA